MSIHQFVSGVHTDPQAIVYYYYLPLNLFNLVKFIVKCILNDCTKCLVLITQGLNHIGIDHSGYKIYGKP